MSGGRTDGLLDVEDLTVSYGRGAVVRGLSLRLARGDVLGLVGESGCGKTTLGWSILGLLPRGARLDGTIRFEGDDLARMEHGVRRRLLGDRLAMIPQGGSGSLDPLYRVGDQIVETILAHRRMSRSEARALALRELRGVGIPDPEARLASYPHELSGGMRQRVSIAAALVLNPALLIADEPTSALDVTIQAQVLALFRDLIHEHAGGAIVITHDLGVVAQLCSRVAVMYAGQIVEEGPVGPIFAEPAHPYTKALVAAHPAAGRRGGRLATIPGTVPDPAHPPAGCLFRPRCPVAIDACRDEVPWVRTARGGVRCVHHVPR